jgi:hypothetical protein
LEWDIEKIGGVGAVIAEDCPSLTKILLQIKFYISYRDVVLALTLHLINANFNNFLLGLKI